MPRLPRHRHFRAAALALAVIASAFAGPAAASEQSLEYAVKATYLYKLAPFVEWPAHAHDPQTGTIDLCVVGEDPFGDTLDRAVAGQQLGGRPFAVRRMRVLDPRARCHVMFLGGSAAQTADALRMARGMPVLTVTDAVADPAAMGIVNFVVVDGRVRFEIDAAAAAQNGIAISSKLLDLAVAVHRGGETPR
ncbi:YfiR family protein [Arenibaculum sp.]|jgi:hypothetical protein|uniref:YfiR family protein n=1 Tax=Arenibaculum sp. TaxID=2865862 RepID=UPI002E0F5D73|nr:YfiR family protein [Arenibaculum sp.]